MFHNDHKFCGGVTSVGERGQVVIPVEVRERMKLKKGEKLLVFSESDKFIGLVRADQMSQFLKKILSHLESRK